MSRAWRSAVLGVVLAACGRQDAPARGVPSPADAAPEGDAANASAADGEATASAPLPWADAIRVGRYAEAAEALAALPDAEKNKNEVRLARARVALVTGKAADAIAVLEKIDDDLPLLRDLVGSIRAQAMAEIGPFDKAAEWLGTRRDGRSLALAAESWTKAGDGVKARAAWDRYLAERRTRAQEENARFKRMTVVRLKEGDAAAQNDARWLTINALDEKVFAEAAELLEKLAPPKLLTADELLVRARTLAEAMRTDDAVHFVDRAAARGGNALDLCRARAEVLYKARTRYPEAALLYRSCAAMGGPHAPEDLFLSARAFSRANRDGDAIPAFQSVIARHPHTPWADQAEFHVARTHVLAGHWRDAANAFDEYAKHYPNGKEKREADRYRALAHLMARDDKRARKLLEDLSGGAEDNVASARWTNLAALAALRDGDKLHAIARWTEVAQMRPLSYPALVARARIKENGGQVPGAIEPAESGGPGPVAVALPPPIDLLHRIGFDAEAEEMLRDREAAIVAQAPTRGNDALCAAYAALGRAKRSFQIARDLPPALFQNAPGGRNGTAWECAYPRPYPLLVNGAGERARVAPDLVWSVMRQESNFDPDVVSPARAVGLMQLLPETARTTAANAKLAHDDAKLTSPAQNIELGTLYLREMLDRLGDSAPLAVAAYNAGPEAIERWLAHAKGETLDVFVEAIPFVETRGYVVRVLGNLARYGYLEHGEAGVPDLALELRNAGKNE